MDEKICGIYKITNLVNGKVYIGKSKDIKSRFGCHKAALKMDVFNGRTNRHLWNAVQKYGLDKFTFEILEQVEVCGDTLSLREMYWIKHYNSNHRDYGYNSMYESSGVFKHSDETVERLREATRKSMTPERRAEISRSLMGKKQSPELVSMRIAKSSKSRIGVKIAEEKKSKMRESHAVYSYEQYSLDGELLQIFKRRKDLIDAGFERVSVQAACVGKLKTHKGFIWKRIPKVALDD